MDVLPIGKPQKNSYLNGLAIKAPLEQLNGCWNVGTLEKKVKKKSIFSLMARPFTPTPPLNGPAIKRRIFLPASLTTFNEILNTYNVCLDHGDFNNFKLSVKILF